MQYAEYSCKKMASSGGKSLAVGHISGFQIDPNTQQLTYLVEICALTQRPCAEGGAWYQNALVFKPQYAISQLESGFSVWIQERGKDVL